MKSLGLLIFKLSCLALLLHAGLEAAAASECKTTDGRKCVFPFTFDKNDNGTELREYNECTWDWAFQTKGKPVIEEVENNLFSA